MARLAMVTGASSGIGVAYAERLASDGWNLLVVARRRERLEALAKRLQDAHGVSVGCIEANLSQRPDVDRVCGELENAAVEMVINNAALAHYMPFAELPSERATELVDLNVKAPVLLTGAALPGMLERGSGAIINVASLLAFSGNVDTPMFPKRAVYAATKSFLVTFSEVVAHEVAGTGVRVQVVCPGVVRSEFHTRQGLDMSEAPRMEPEDVVRASLADLDAGVLVSVPGLEDTDILSRADAANQQLTAVARTKELPARYADRPA